MNNLQTKAQQDKCKNNVQLPLKQLNESDKEMDGEKSRILLKILYKSHCRAVKN